MADFFSNSRQAAGNAVDWLGTILNAPEYGLSERIAGGYTQNTGVTPQSQDVFYQFKPNPQYGPAVPPGQVPGSYSGPSGGGGGQQPQPSQPSQPSGPSQDALAAIDNLYNQTISTIGDVQSNLQREQSSEVSQVQQGQQRTQKALGQAQTGRLTDIGARRTEGQKQETSSLEQLRQLYGDLQSQQIAQLSAAGISSSSAAEALGAYLSRDQAQRVGNVVSTTGDIMAGLSDEEKNVNDWYQQSTLELQQDTQNKVDQINRDFGGRISQLNQLRGQSAVARQQQRADLFNQYQQQLSDLNSYAQQANYALQSWQQTQSQNLTNARQALGGIPLQQIQNLASQTGGNISGQIQQGPNGQYFIVNPRETITPNSIIQPTAVGGGPVTSGQPAYGNYF